ncbi:MAG TPA: ATP-dependent zinc metalloprotease FtsH [Bacillota bacterium]|nr:ATP-dependent zinc metalloprotease FtsH [Bacillota bacterium]HOH09454.1 ATP-dependent zinc metalloprotease FtsH [Bacillota bacterium]
MNRGFQKAALWILIFLVAVTIGQNFLSSQNKVQEMTANSFLTQWEAGNVKTLDILPEGIIKGELNDGTKFQLYYSSAAGLIDDVKKNPEKFANTTVSEKPKTNDWLLVLLPNLFFIVALGLFFMFMLNQMQGSNNRAMQFGRSRARLQTDARGKITFADVAGIDEVQEELAEIVDYLKYPRRFTDMGARVPKGILLMGPPGTGKTHITRALAGEAGVPFFYISGSDFVEMFVGVGASRVRDMFAQAKKSAPCIIFIDEIDAVGRQRGAGLGGGHDEREQTLNQLLVEMDGFETNSGVIVVAATNRPDVLDPALLRPGRFDRQITLDVPDAKGREAILKIHARNKQFAGDMDMKELARRTPGFTGADLENLLNEAALLAVRYRMKKITMDVADEAIERIVMGPAKKGRLLTGKEKDLVAYHETGHALLAKLLPGSDPVVKVSIIGRGSAGGFTLVIPEDERKFRYSSKEDLLNNITMSLGGRVAEELCLEDVSTGASKDLERATSLARKMVVEYGMSNLGPITYGRQDSQNVFLGRDISRERNYSEEIAAQIDKEVKNIIDECYTKAKKLLGDNLELLKRVAMVLKERENLEGSELDLVLEGKELPPKEVPQASTPTPDTEQDRQEKQEVREPQAYFGRKAAEQH